ncbi:unnamed protein product [Dovyalis caffra]|uniref:Cytochrome P450 n=1 Tax=Dovyalis caffra TaxID=77055 RepID=A0AAV1RN25_9ROSI|nr:unnamed protein product [Dovyalis caffra]
MGERNKGDFIPWLAFLDMQEHIKRMKATAKKMDVFMQHVLEEHYARRKGVKEYEPRDMLNILVQVAENPNLEVKLDRIGVKAFTQVIQTSVANLLQGFKWKLPGKMTTEDLNMEEIFGLSVPRKVPLVAVVEPRLPSELYSL